MAQKLTTAARLFLGFVFLVFGINGFYTFIPVPEFHPFMEIMVDSGYIYLIKAIEIVAGLMLLSNRFVALAVVLLTAIVVNIAAYHALIDNRNWFMALVLAAPLAVLLLDRWQELRPLFLPTRTQE